MKTDLTYLKNMAGGNLAFVKEMIQIFTEQIAEIKADMLSTHASKNWKSLGKLAHKAKSSVAVMGMTELADELKTLERLAGEEKEIEKYKAIVDKFIVDSEQALIELKKASNEL